MILMGQIVTSIRVDKEVWKEAKIYCVKNNLTLGELVEMLIKKEVERKRKETQPC